ncbi:beta-aspartyl-peptidase [Shewanella xiamenensis]|uniref:Isoaspartyl dipeptidase n=1 Tax=Shewanella xiamenensis TaxID=332186 RepID=A0ABT6UHF0_9GAMM|nr:beta-aspartyl-peptidase [Shewanella xiamenensis]MDI5833478.1 beta-aspartyl-peptidase [Shewanella xiamenensis]UML94492.1 beta-aspartyl-peptidase [Shewanella xiamenensis]
MLTLIRNALVYSPQLLGLQDVLFCGSNILQIAKGIKLPNAVWVKEVDADGCILIPGLVDPLVHITGGGGEGGYHTRTPEMQLTDATLAGVTTLVAALGTDAVSRSLNELVIKARALTYEGLSVFCYTGSYEFPVKTITGDVTQDLMMIDNVIGVGEIAIADHRGSQLSVAELARVAAQSRVGGMLSGKAGIVFVHVGDGASGLKLLHQVAQQSDIPLTQFYPTHINRSQPLLEQGVEFAKKGGVIDFTTSTNQHFLNHGEVSVVSAVKFAFEQGVELSRISLSSDGNASLPVFDSAGECIGVEVGKVSSLFNAMQALIISGFTLEQILPLVTSNAARNLKLKRKGGIGLDKDADFVLLDHKLAINKVWGKGQLLVDNGIAVKRGTFELY